MVCGKVQAQVQKDDDTKMKLNTPWFCITYELHSLFTPPPPVSFLNQDRKSQGYFFVISTTMASNIYATNIKDRGKHSIKIHLYTMMGQ